MSDEMALELKLQHKGLTEGARVTPAIVDAAIAQYQYIRPAETTMTICVMELQNGFVVTGESACLNPANFDEEMGRTIAYRNARDKIWQLEAYRLASEGRE